jgi:hypothetical protein
MEEALTLARIEAAQQSASENLTESLMSDTEAYLTALLAVFPQEAAAAFGRVGFVPNPHS